VRPATEQRRIRLENELIYAVGHLRSIARARVAAVIVRAFRTCEHSVSARLDGAQRLRGTRVADVDLLELRVDDEPWTPAGDFRAA